MKLSEYSIQNLAKGDCGFTRYLSGPNLVLLFNKYGFADVYEQGFPSRWKYTEDNLREMNGKDSLRMLLEEILDPRRFYDTDLDVDAAVKSVNDCLKYDKYEVKSVDGFYKIYDSTGVIVQAETTKAIDHDFAREQIEKCNQKILTQDYGGAITNARSLVEAILIEIIEQLEDVKMKNDGKLDNLWKRVKKLMKLNIEKTNMPDTIIQILSGLDSIIYGLAGLSNESSDRHATKFKVKMHHAKLAVNSATTICDFLLDSLSYQTNKS